ncbi:hypothetical protein D3C87_1942010 [compost metagenome]
MFERFVVERFEILAHGTRAECGVRPVGGLTGRNTALAASISSHDAGIDSEAFAFD